jgi:hypothetical protein
MSFYLRIDYHGIEFDLGGVFLCNHWTYVSDCPRFVNEQSPFIDVPQQSAWTAVESGCPR